jgi:hypothetical protein
VTGIFGFVYFGMLNTGVAAIIFLAIVLSLVPHDMMYCRAVAPAFNFSRSQIGCLPFLPTRCLTCLDI